jgi:predicted alpha/beta-fold hydrolase
MKQKHFLFPYSKRWFLITALMILVALWAAIPAIRAFTLVANPFGRSTPHNSSTDLPVQEVHFTASDGVHLAGWLAIASPRTPTIILVHGFKGSRVDMLPWAQFLYHAGGYNVLLYDSRGCGESEGWGIALGTREPDDVIGAVQYLEQRSDLTNKHFGALGISLGAGIVLLAAAREPALQATVADSAWVDESAQINRMNHLSALPLLPYEPTLVDNLIGTHLEDARPLDVISHISPRAVMLIHSADDANTTTPLTGEHQLYQAAQSPRAQWIAPSGGHTGALKAHAAEYEQRVLEFFSAYINKH